jgi:hypothetical protein
VMGGSCTRAFSWGLGTPSSSHIPMRTSLATKIGIIVLLMKQLGYS